MIGRRLVLAGMAGLTACASQARTLAPTLVAYDRSRIGGGMRIGSQWSEPDGTVRHLSFTLPPEALTEAARQVAPPRPEQVQHQAMAAAQAVADHAPAGVQLDLRPKPFGLDLHGTAPLGYDLTALMNTVMAAYRQANNQAVIDAGFRFIAENVVQPDYARITAGQSALLDDTAREIGRQMTGLDARGRVQFLLSFLQSLTYQVLHSRGQQAMRTPAGVLADGRGDCDAKSITLATLLAVIDPGLSTVLIYDDQHAFPGVALPVLPGDPAFQLGGRSYVAVEPVGPGWFPVGQLSDQSRAILASGVAKTTLLRG